MNREERSEDWPTGISMVEVQKIRRIPQRDRKGICVLREGNRKATEGVSNYVTGCQQPKQGALATGLVNASGTLIGVVSAEYGSRKLDWR